MQDIIAIQRNDQWLTQLLHTIWMNHFPDIPEQNAVIIRFGRKARGTLGSIRYDRKKDASRILINGLFKHPAVPQEIVQAVIAHEVIHYVHGFASRLPKRARYPHRGSLVTNEMKQRGLGDLLLVQKRWMKSEWPPFLQKQLPRTLRKRAVRYRKLTLPRLLRMLLS